MKTSARNQYHGRVKSLDKGAVNAEVVLELDDHTQVVAIITNTSVEQLNLSQGSEAWALIKASAVIVTPDQGVRTSARNQLCGQVVECREGAVNGEVIIKLDGGKSMTAIVTNESIRKLGLRQGSRACALVKASSVILAVA